MLKPWLLGTTGGLPWPGDSMKGEHRHVPACSRYGASVCRACRPEPCRTCRMMQCITAPKDLAVSRQRRVRGHLSASRVTTDLISQAHLLSAVCHSGPSHNAKLSRRSTCSRSLARTTRRARRDLAPVLQRTASRRGLVSRDSPVTPGCIEPARQHDHGKVARQRRRGLGMWVRPSRRTRPAKTRSCAWSRSY